MKLADRAAGLLLHVTSLPGPYHTGDLGEHAHAFVDFLARAGQRWWQMLPVNPIGDGNSPYSTISSFAGEPLLLDLAPLVARGWLTRAEVGKPAAGGGRLANYDAARAFRLSRLRLAFSRAEPKLARQAGFAAFRAREADWLADFALFGALADHQGTPDWSRWPADVKNRVPAALGAARRDLHGSVAFLEFTQYLFAAQWTALRQHAGRRGVGLLGDLPIFVSHGSADVWAHPRFFQLDAAGRPRVVSGAPPDAFNRRGQLWGNALYDWPALERDGFRWWLARLCRVLSLFDAVRLDHFIGFSRYWEIDARAKTAAGGRWRAAPGEAFFTAVTAALKDPQLIAEDLGAVTPAVRALRDQFGFAGMKVLQFAFDGCPEAEEHKPHRLTAASVAYSGTHDNNTSRGWYEDLLARARSRDRRATRELAVVQAYLDPAAKTVAWDLLRAAYGSPANTVIIPAQDVLGLGARDRMNTPGVAKNNWRWRLRDGQLDEAACARLAAAAQVYGRDGR